jgi:hypothetical protein
MTYGIQSTDSGSGGLQSPGTTPQVQANQDTQQALNRQQQRRYAPWNGMNKGRQQRAQVAPPWGGTAPSPVTADGKINEANGPQPQQATAIGDTGGFQGGQPPAPPPDWNTWWSQQNAQPMPKPGLDQPIQMPYGGMEQPVLHGGTPYPYNPNPNPGGPQTMPWDPNRQGFGGSPGSIGPSVASGAMPMEQVDLDGNIVPGDYPGRGADTVYTPGQLTQWGGGYNQGTEGAVESALLKALEGGGGLPVEMMKGLHRDDTLAMRDQELSQGRDFAAGMGRLGGGFDAANQQNIRSGAVENLLGGYRDINIKDQLARNEFGLRGIEAGNNFLTGQMGRRTTDYLTGLEGEKTQEGLYQDAAKQNLNGYLADLQGYLGNKGLDINAQSSRYGYITDLLRIMEQARGNDQNAAIGWGGILNNAIGGLR